MDLRPLHDPGGADISVVRWTTRASEHGDGESTSSKENRIIARRGVMLWLPVYCSNDVVHGSW